MLQRNGYNVKLSLITDYEFVILKLNKGKESPALLQGFQWYLIELGINFP